MQVAIAPFVNVINIGTGEEVSINTLAKLAIDLAGSTSVISYAPARPGDIRRSVTTMDKARALLSFAPKVSFADGLAHTLAWVRTQL